MHIEVGSHLSSCDLITDIITLGYEFKHAEVLLSEENFSTFLSDTITHEFLHTILAKEFNRTVSALFDAIEHFVFNIDVKERVFKDIRINFNSDLPQTWHDAITTDGFNLFLKEYHITNNAFKEAYVITGGVKK